MSAAQLPSFNKYYYRALPAQAHNRIQHYSLSLSLRTTRPTMMQSLPLQTRR
jgi:hypothetical protein